MRSLLGVAFTCSNHRSEVTTSIASHSHRPLTEIWVVVVALCRRFLIVPAAPAGTTDAFLLVFLHLFFFLLDE